MRDTEQDPCCFFRLNNSLWKQKVQVADQNNCYYDLIIEYY